MTTKIYIVSHKDVDFDNAGLTDYLPVQVGDNSSAFAGYLRDNGGDNIAAKNPYYSELTAQYWAWKNQDADIKGLVHYRRFFVNRFMPFWASRDQKMAQIVSSQKIQSLLTNYDIIVPTKRRYYIETSWSHYEHAHHIIGMETARDVIAHLYPDYLADFDKVMKRRSAHMFNMLIARGTVFDDYSEWMFNVLFHVEDRLRDQVADWSRYEQRIYGYVSELLLDVWLEKNPQLRVKELPVAFLEKQNWLKKGGRFVGRKFGLKYNNG